MLRINAAERNDEHNIITLFEIMGIFVLFTALLILFFPKDKIEQMVHHETTNYQLSIRYLTNIIHSYPEDTKAKMLLAQLYVKTGQFEEATAILDGLSTVDGYKKKVLYLQYDLLKEKYFHQKKREGSPTLSIQTERILKKLSDLTDDKTELHFLWKEAKRMNMQRLAVEIEIKMIEKGYLLADEAYKTVQKAQFLKMERSVKTLLETSTSFEKDPRWLQVAGEFYEKEKQYARAIEKYEALLAIEKNSERQKKIFLKLLYLYVSVSRMDKLETLSQNYEALIYSDDELTKKMIEFHIGKGNIDLAKRMSLKWLSLHSLTEDH